MDDFEVTGKFVGGLIVNLRAVLILFMEHGLFLAVHKIVLSAPKVK